MKEQNEICCTVCDYGIHDEESRLVCANIESKYWGVSVDEDFSCESSCEVAYA